MNKHSKFVNFPLFLFFWFATVLSQNINTNPTEYPTTHSFSQFPSSETPSTSSSSSDMPVTSPPSEMPSLSSSSASSEVPYTSVPSAVPTSSSSLSSPPTEMPLLTSPPFSEMPVTSPPSEMPTLSSSSASSEVPYTGVPSAVPTSSSSLSSPPTEMPLLTSPPVSEMPVTSPPSEVPSTSLSPSDLKISSPPSEMPPLSSSSSSKAPSAVPTSSSSLSFPPTEMPSTSPISEMPVTSPPSEMPTLSSSSQRTVAPSSASSSPSSEMQLSSAPSTSLQSSEMPSASPLSDMPSTHSPSEMPTSVSPISSERPTVALLANSVSPSASPSSDPTVLVGITMSPSAVPSSSPVKKTYICLYGNCRGAPADCIPGAICQYSNPYYSQCVEDPAYRAATNCRKTNEYGCGGAAGGPFSSCCNPSAVCNADRVCILPQPTCVNDAASAPSSQPAQSLSLQPAAPSPSPSRSPAAAPTQVVCLWGDCSAPSSACAVGLTCKWQSAYYSQCVEDARFSTGRSDCHATNQWGCGGLSGPSACCNPGAVCNSQHVCEIRTSGCRLHTAAPTPQPSGIFNSSQKFPASRTICLYGDCTDPTTRCVAGTKCQFQNAYYSQCLEDPSFSALPSDSCHAKYDWGCGGGRGATGCCNPAAACDSNHMCQLSSACVYYAPSAPAAAKPAAPEISFVATIGLSVPAGTTSLSDSEQLAVCLSSELAVKAPPGSCKVVNVSTSLNPANTAPPLHTHLLASKTAHTTTTTTTTIYAKTKITASANNFQSFPPTQNVSFLFQQLSQSLVAAIAQGTFTKALQSNSRKLNCSRTVSSTAVAGELVVDPLTVTVAVAATASPSAVPSFVARLSSPAVAVSAQDGMNTQYIVIGSVVGGCGILALVAFVLVLQRRNLLRRPKQQQPETMKQSPLCASDSDEVLVDTK